MHTLEATFDLLADLWATVSRPARRILRTAIIFFAAYPLFLMVVAMIDLSALKSTAALLIIPAVIMIAIIYPLVVTASFAFPESRQVLRILATIIAVELTMGVYISIIPVSNNLSLLPILAIVVAAIAFHYAGTSGPLSWRVVQFLFWAGAILTFGFIFPKVFGGVLQLFPKTDMAGSEVFKNQAPGWSLLGKILLSGIVFTAASLWKKLPGRSGFRGLGILALVASGVMYLFPGIGQGLSFPSSDSGWKFSAYRMDHVGRPLPGSMVNMDTKVVAISDSLIEFQYVLPKNGGTGFVNLISTDGENFEGTYERPGVNGDVVLQKKSPDLYLGREIDPAGVPQIDVELKR